MKTLLMLTLILSSLTCWSATTATLNLKGNITEHLEVSIAAEAIATSLPLDQSINNQKVARVTEKSNLKSGYKISVVSANGGKLVRTGDPTNFITYQLSYNGQLINLSTAPVVIYTNADRGQFERDLTITYTKPADFTAAGDYSDTVTFNITPN